MSMQDFQNLLAQKEEEDKLNDSDSAAIGRFSSINDFPVPHEEGPAVHAEEPTLPMEEEAVPPVAQAPQSTQPDSNSVLRQFFARKAAQDQLDANRMTSATDLAEKNKLFARIGQAASNLGSSIAKADRPNQQPFEDLAKDADQPVQHLKDRMQLQGNQDKILRDYLLRDASLQSRQNIASQQGDRYGKRTDAMTKLGEGRLALGQQTVGIRKAGLDLRSGAQAAQAAQKFNGDKVISTSNTQLAQIDKGVGMLDKIDKGEIKFTTSIKADLEKDLANTISGGTSSSLGQLDRIEYKSGVEAAQRMLDYVRGYQGDINAPEFKKQLRAQFNALKQEIQGIQSRRAAQIQKSYGTAYSSNPLATQTLQDNANLYNQGAPSAQAPAPGIFSDPEKEKRYQAFKASQGK